MKKPSPSVALLLIPFALLASACPFGGDTPIELVTPVISSVSPGWISNDHHPAVPGQADGGAEITLFGSPDCWGSVLGRGTADNDGRFSVTIDVADNSETHLSALATLGDSASDCGVASSPYREDSAAPGAPTG